MGDERDEPSPQGSRGRDDDLLVEGEPDAPALQFGQDLDEAEPLEVDRRPEVAPPDPAGRPIGEAKDQGCLPEAGWLIHRIKKIDRAFVGNVVRELAV
ncbi:MAG TPA: hypothetical protein VHL09_01250 [Dehalococcoidia bacterium]|nr:hypothetical protein [Dehalococcoidia bacterium]